MAKSKRSRKGRQNKVKSKASATAIEEAKHDEQLVEELPGNISSNGSNLAVMIAPTAIGTEAPPPASEPSENVDSGCENTVNIVLDADVPTDSAKTIIGGAPATVQSAGRPNAPVSALAVAARPTTSPLEEVDMNVEKFQQELKIAEEQDVSISLMAVSATDSSSTEYGSVEIEEENEDDSEAESALLLPNTPRNDSDDGPAAPASTNSSVSDSSSDFTFDLDYEPSIKKLDIATAPAPASPKVVVRPPAIFVNNIADFNPSCAKRPRLDLSCLTSLDLPSTDDHAAAAAAAASTDKEEAKPRPVARVSEEALASLSVTHIASDLVKYYVRTRAPAFLQKFIFTAPEEEKTTASADEASGQIAAAEVFGFGSPIDNIVRTPGPWEEGFGSPLDDASRPPAPWEEEEENKKEVDAVLPDTEKNINEEEKKEEWEEMKHREWHDDVPMAPDATALRKAWLDYCKERSKKIEEMLEIENQNAAAEAKFEAEKIAFKELETTVLSNKRKLSDVACARLCYFNLLHSNHSYKDLTTRPFLNDLVRVTSPMKHRFLENDYSQQVARRMSPFGPGFGTGLGIVLEYPYSENSQRDMRLAEAAASQAMYYFSNGSVEYVRPPVERSKDELENVPILKNNPARFKQSGVIVTRECGAEYFYCTVDRPPMDLAVRKRHRGAPFKKHLVSDVWKVPPPPLPARYNTFYCRNLNRFNKWKYAIDYKLEFAFGGWFCTWGRQKLKGDELLNYSRSVDVFIFLVKFVYKVYKYF